MAEFAAHLTSVADHTRPSLFEVLAQESLAATLRPALTHLLKFVAEKNPGAFGWMYRYGDEIYALLDMILQNHFLAKQSGSFPENFYSMRRVPTTGKQQSLLTRSQHCKSLLFLILIPYIKLKLDKLHARWKEAAPSSDNINRLWKIYIQVYPFIHMSWEGSFLIYQMRYLFHKSNVHSPYLHLAGLRLVYLSPDDLPQSLPQYSRPDLHLLRWQSRLGHGFRRLLGLVAIGLSQGLSVGVFFLQFLEWWYMYGDQQAHITSLPVPSPPANEIQEELKHLLPVDESKCPLCQRVRTNHATLSTSGFVFCYPCIFKYVKNHDCCPISKYPTSLDQVIKLYPPSE